MTEVTGEAVALGLRPATVPSRLLATLIDLGVTYLVAVAAVAGLSAVAGGDAALLAALAIVLGLAALVGYPVTAETLGGRTLGKAALGLRVVRLDGGPIRFRQALVRALLGCFVERPGITFGLAAIISSAVSARGQRLGDLLAGTMVVHTRVPVSGAAPVFMPPWLIPWAQYADLSGVDDSLALASRQLLGRFPQLDPNAAQHLASDLAGQVLARVSPPPPPGTAPWDFLAAVLAERRRREQLRG